MRAAGTSWRQGGSMLSHVIDIDVRLRNHSGDTLLSKSADTALELWTSFTVSASSGMLAQLPRKTRHTELVKSGARFRWTGLGTTTLIECKHQHPGKSSFQSHGSPIALDKLGKRRVLVASEPFTIQGQRGQHAILQHHISTFRVIL